MLNGLHRIIHCMAGAVALALTLPMAAAETPVAEATPAFLADSLKNLESAPTAFQTPDLLPTLLNVVMSLGVVVVLIYMLYWGLRRWQASRGVTGLGGSDTSAIKVLEKNFLDARRGVAVVELGEEIYYLGLGENVTVLGKVSDPEAIERVRAMTPITGSFSAFPEQMEKVASYLRRNQWQKSRVTLREESASLKSRGQKLRQSGKSGRGKGS